MLNRNFSLTLIAIVALLLPVNIAAQTNTLNTYSTYSMYGLGELQNQGTLATRSLGGAGVAMRSFSSVNTLNPASYSAALRKGVLLNYGVEGRSSLSAQSIDGEVQRGGYTTANFNNIALQMPLAKGLGMGFSVTPYSEVGYRQLSDDIIPNLGYIEYENAGSGYITEVKFGVGWEIVTGLSVGFAAQYYWGDINRTFTADITNMTTTGSAISLSGIDELSVSKIKGQFGLQSEIINSKSRVLTLGLTANIGGDLTPRYVRAATALTQSTDVYAQSDTTSLSLVMPREITLGAEYRNQKLLLLADVNYQAWGKNNGVIDVTQTGMVVAYNDMLTVKAGVQYTPRVGDVRHYFNRVQYRFGARYGGYQYSYSGENISQMALSAGAGFPIKIMGVSKINAGVEWSQLGSTKEITVSGQSVGLVRQTCIKFSLGFTLFGDDYWFHRPQID